MRQQSSLRLLIAMLMLAAGIMTVADSVFGEAHDKLEMAAEANEWGHAFWFVDELFSAPWPRDE